MKNINFDQWLGTTLREYREKAGMTQEEVASKLHMKRGAISHYEVGRRSMTAQMFMNYCKAVGIDPQEIVRKRFL